MNRWPGTQALLALALVSCGGRQSVGAAADGGDADEGGGGIVLEAGQYDPGGDAGAFSASQVQAALAQCDLPHGPAVQISSGDDEQTLLAGAWVLCPGGAPANVVTVFTPGLIVSPAGQWTRLAADADGGLTAAEGVENQGSWDAFCEASTGIPNSQPCVFGGEEDVDVRITASSQDMSTDGCFGGPITFESSPRRMFVVDFPALYCDVHSTLGTFDLWLVPL